MAQAQSQAMISRATKHQTPALRGHIYSLGDNVLVWRDKIANNRTNELIGPYTMLHHDALSKIIAINQDGAVKLHSKAQVRPFYDK